MKIVICDDELEYLNLLRIHVQEYMKTRYIECEITATTNPVEILNSTKSFDLAFLDIQMDGIDGISLAKELRKRNSKLALFFVTNFDEYQDDAMDLHAFRFFEKPFHVDRLYSGLDRVMEYINRAYVDVFLYEDGVQKRICIDDIVYITRKNRKTAFITNCGNYYSKESMDAWCQKLPPLFFYPVHNSFLVNLHYVTKYSYSELYLNDDTRIPIAPRKQSSFHKFWFEYLRRR